MAASARTRRDPRLAAMSEADRAQTAIERFRNTATEADMEATIRELVERKGGRVFHLRDARRAPELEGLVDLIIICPPVVGLVELKSVKRKITPQQQHVADLLDECHSLIVGIFRPYQLDELLEALA